jgi:hypothetical protein
MHAPGEQMVDDGVKRGVSVRITSSGVLSFRRDSAIDRGESLAGLFNLPLNSLKMTSGFLNWLPLSLHLGSGSLKVAVQFDKLALQFDKLGEILSLDSHFPLFPEQRATPQNNGLCLC